MTKTIIGEISIFSFCRDYKCKLLRIVERNYHSRN